MDTFMTLFRFDRKHLKGTRFYLGLAFFWHMDYKHYMRDATWRQRRMVHRAFRKANLNIAGRSPQHAAIIDRITTR